MDDIANLVERNPIANYNFPVSDFAKSGQQKISDLRLKAALSGPHSVKLLSAVIGGVEYDLRLSGEIIGVDNQSKLITAESITESQIDALEKGTGMLPTLTHNPFFEWVSEDGDPIGEMFNEIWLDPNVEICYLQRLLA